MKIVLTGGPSAGKTTVAEILCRNEWFRLVGVPEAASILYRGGFPRNSEKIHVRCQQRAIYHVQRELEEISTLDGMNRSLICDRGSLDGLAYWPDHEEQFFEAMGSTMENEVARYDWVLHLDTAAPEHYRSSEIRKEESAEAAAVNQLVKHAWRKHPQRIIIPNSVDFLQKIDTTIRVVEMILDGRSIEMIRQNLA